MNTSATQHLTRPEGRIAYEITGEGPLVLLVPGMGDLRSTYRFVIPRLVAAGLRVCAVDLRGHGDSDAGFSSYGDQETASDLEALLDTIGGPAVVVGNSMGAASATLLAAQRPELVRGLVLLGPFVRNGDVTAWQRLMLRVAMAPPWAATSWKAYSPRLYAGRKPDDLDAHLAAVHASLRRRGYAKAFSLTTRTSHAPAESRLADVTAPTAVVMGELDPDFPDPAAEAQWIAAALRGTVAMVPDSGHYPQSQQPDTVVAAILDLARRANIDG